MWSGTTLGAHTRGRHTSPPLGGVLRGNSRPTPPQAPAGGRVIRVKGVSPTYPPPQGPRLAGPRTVFNRLTGHGGSPVTRVLCPPLTPVKVCWGTPPLREVRR